jgi:hypothetical protein
LYFEKHGVSTKEDFEQQLRKLGIKELGGDGPKPKEEGLQA